MPRGAATSGRWAVARRANGTEMSGSESLRDEPAPDRDPSAAPGGDGAPDPELRPRPAYGEYATPEQQRAAIRQPGPEASAPPVGTAAPVAPAPSTASTFVPARPTHATTSAARPTRTADRVITVALLAYGLITVISAVPQLWHFTDFAQTAMKIAGIDAPFTNTAQGDLWGRIGAIVFLVGWLLTAALSWRAIARARLGWWIPLVGAIVTFVMVTVCVTVPLFGDPAIVAHVAR